MNTLAFDTCFGACSVAATWAAPGGTRGSAFRFERLERGHAERLVPLIGAVMNEAPFAYGDIARLVVTVGPGTFTGQRVGIAAARALMLATGAPVATLSSLAVMAHGAAALLGAEASDAVLVSAVDARRGEIYVQSFAGPLQSAREAPRLTTPEDAVACLAGAACPLIAVGSGAQALAAAGAAAGLAIVARLDTLEPDVRFVPEAALHAQPVAPRPLYLRPPDAKPQTGAALARQA